MKNYGDAMRGLAERFHKPDPAFSAMPFWFWNGDMRETEIRRQMEAFQEKGIHGFILHPRMGIPRALGYLSDRFMELVRFAVALAAEMGMKVILYDEGMYPSGSACGMVCRENPRYASRGIILLEGMPPQLDADRRLIARIALQKTGAQAYSFASARLLKEGELPGEGETAVAVIEAYTGGTIRGIHEGQDDGEPDAPPSGDLLGREAMQCFIRLTHDRYYGAVGEYFGNTILAMFTDEPNPVGRNAPRSMRAWTWGLEEEWIAQGHTLESLPALFLDAGEGGEAVRRTYEAFVADRMQRTYYGPLSEWCQAHGIVLTGHPAEADSIGLERFFGIPGQDIVWRFVEPEDRHGLEGKESTQAKCASDSARHRGKRRNSNECFGCCGPNGHHWAMTLDDVKWILDWLFVRGTNMIYPHAFFYAVDTPLRWGERPPDVGPNSYWWPQQRRISDYISRMCGLLTDGVNQARVAILCEGASLPWRLAACLFERQVEFNYLEAELLPQSSLDKGRLCLWEQAYDTIAVEDETILTPEIQVYLEAFASKGGTVMVLDGQEWRAVEAMADALVHSGMQTVTLDPPCNDLRATHLRHGGVDLFLLTNEGEEAWSGGITLPVQGACWRWDAWTGESIPQGRSAAKLPLKLERRTSMVYVVDPEGVPVEAQEGACPPKDLHPFHTVTDWKAAAQGRRMHLEKLEDWQRWSGMEAFNGTVVYETECVLEEVLGRLWLDLGDVREMAVVRINDGPEEALLLRPFQMEVTGRLVRGHNRIEVAVTSGNVTRYEGIPWPCGLLGPVRLLKEPT